MKARLLEALKVSQQITDLENRFLDKKIENLREQLALGNSTLEQEQELADLIAEREQRETSNLEAQTTIQNKLNVLTQGAAKAHGEVKDAVEGSLKSLNERLSKLNEEIVSGNFSENAIRDKLKEIINLEDEIERITAKIQQTRNALGFQGSLETLQEDPFGRGVQLDQIDPASDPEVQRDVQIQEALASSRQAFDEAEKERMMKAAEERKKIREEERAAQLAIANDTYEQLGAAFGRFATSDINTLKDFTKEALGILVDFVAKQINVLLLGEQAKALSNPISAAKAAIVTGLIKALLAKVKSSVQQLEEGGQLNPGFVAKGPRHAHGGIRVGNQEIEGGEPVLTRRAAQLFPNEINAINMASGGRRILGRGGILQEGGILGTTGPVLSTAFLNGGSSQVDPDALADRIASAVYRAAATGINDANRRGEREQEFQQRSVA